MGIHLVEAVPTAYGNVKLNPHVARSVGRGTVYLAVFWIPTTM